MANKPKPKQKAAETKSRTPPGKSRTTRPSGASSAKARTGVGWDEVFEWLAGLVSALVVLAVGLGYSGQVYALYFTPRMVFFFLFAAVLFLLFILVARPGLRRVPLDWLDALGGAFILWQVVSSVTAPIPNLAWFGTYNRTSGAFLWIALAVTLLIARRLLAGSKALRPLVWGVSLVLFLNAVTATVQASGGTTFWGGVVFSQGRMTGTTGNAVNMAGLCLLSAWLGGLVLLGGELSRGTRWIAIVGSLSGLVATVLAVSRASYIGLALAVVVLAALLLLRRRWRSAVILAVVVVAFAAGTLAYTANSGHITASVSGGSGSASGGSGLSESDQQRIDFWKVALRATKERPLTGFGPGAFADAFRRFVPAALLQEQPNMVVSDPHDLPLLMAAAMGIPGLLLGMGLLLAAAAVLGVRVVKRLREPVKARSAHEVPRSGLARPGAGLAYALAVLAFLLVSPTDLVTMAPLMLVLGASVGSPKEGDRFTLAIPAFKSRKSLGMAVTGALGAIAVGAVVVAMVMGVRFFQADVASTRATRDMDAQQAVRAAQLFPWYPHYEQIAGGILWREALAGTADSSQAQKGEALILSSLLRDPGQILARADLARFYLAMKNPQKAVDELRKGLAYAPNSPTLQALYAYSAYSAFKESNDPALAAAIQKTFAALPPTVADGWYWLNQALSAEGDATNAAVALAKAKLLAPNLTPDDYTKRLQGG